MLTKQEIDTVQSDWAKVAPIADTAATLFYGRLFELDPKLRPLFKSNLEEQKKKLMQTLGIAVKGLGDLGDLVPALQSLGKKHTAYGVQAKDYDAVGAALIWTLKKGLGDAFGPANEAAWGKVYGIVAKTMIEAAAEEKEPMAATV